MTLACESRGPAPPRRYIVTQYSGPDLLGGYRSCRSESEPERNGENEITHHAVLPHALKRQDDLVFGPSQHLAVWRQRPKHSRGQPARDLLTERSDYNLVPSISPVLAPAPAVAGRPGSHARSRPGPWDFYRWPCGIGRCRRQG